MYGVLCCPGVTWMVSQRVLMLHVWFLRGPDVARVVSQGVLM